MAEIVEKFENMPKRMKLILSFLGVCAVVVPAILLLVVSSATKKEPEVVTTKRSVDSQNIEKMAKTTPSPSLKVIATPVPASPSARPAESTSSGN